MSSTLPRVLVWIPCRLADGKLADTVDAVVAQTHEPMECRIQVESGDPIALEAADTCRQLYPDHDIRVVTQAMGEAIPDTTARLVLPIRPGQILLGDAVARLVEAWHHDPSLGVVFSQPAAGVSWGPSGRDRPALEEVVRKPRPFECALYHRLALVGLGFDRDTDKGLCGSYATWDLWVRLLALGHRFHRLHQRLLAEVGGTHPECLWALSLDPQQALDLNQWARLVRKNRAYFSGARVELAGAILEEGTGLAPETRLQLVQALCEDGWAEAAGPHAEALLREDDPGLLPATLAWLTHVCGMSQLARGQLGKAADSFRRVLAVQPAHAHAHGMLARIAQAQGDPDRALRHAEDALELDPGGEWRQLDVLVQPAPRPYVVFHPGRENEDGRQVLWPVFEAARREGTLESTFLYGNQRHGLAGQGFALARARMNRRPDALVVSRSWWGEAHEVAEAARACGVPVVMVHDGAMFLRNDQEAYPESIYPAEVGCLWGWRDLELWQDWNPGDRFVVTGNPCLDALADFRPEPAREPQRYALWLCQGSAAAANNLRGVMDVVVPESMSPNLLFNLVAGSEIVVAHPGPAMLPALHFQKPIFLRGHGYHFEEFRRCYVRVFNFLSDAGWSQGVIEDAIRPTAADYEHFAHKADGNSTARVLEVIEEYAFRSRARRAQVVALPDPTAAAWA